MKLIEVFEKVNKVNLSYEFTSRRDGDSPILIADNTKALKTINWKPKRCLEEICIDGYNWLNKSNSLYLKLKF